MLSRLEYIDFSYFSLYPDTSAPGTFSIFKKFWIQTHAVGRDRNIERNIEHFGENMFENVNNVNMTSQTLIISKIIFWTIFTFQKSAHFFRNIQKFLRKYDFENREPEAEQRRRWK